MTGLKIVRLANFVTPASGGLRTALHELGSGYLAAGHEPVLIVPGERESDEDTSQGRVITLPGPELPGTGGYRVLGARRRLREVLERIGPDRLEVSDRTTLRWTGEWARRHRIPSVMVSHETADGVLRTWGVPGVAAARAADRLNLRTAWAYSRIVCTTEWAEREFLRIGARNVVRAPLGVDLRRCTPERRSAELRSRYARPEEVLLVLGSRLSVEKRPGTALDALAELRKRGVPAVLVVAGDGPLRAGLVRRARAERLPALFLGHVADRAAMADLQATADVCLAPGPAETFGLSALEALACGTPVVASASSALPEVIGDAGIAARDNAAAFADAIQELMARPEGPRRAAARARAELFSWENAVAAFLAAHDVPLDVSMLNKVPSQAQQVHHPEGEAR
ncbi:glycosyltransferase [Streptomyces sp. 35G-GA-8]|uniref:glycosyltransferase n=1 Tax=Streptomyces sp. 35G-GA-8 TaxID=2939434 RepID=UPI00201F94C6|nr:glycosyltransferase [Streptomyces sp. 35G-GA-8]MCL7378986.1 glycosyltransferase [Streptomyces sp. 35G-GA-8]